MTKKWDPRNSSWNAPQYSGALTHGDHISNRNPAGPLARSMGKANAKWGRKGVSSGVSVAGSFQRRQFAAQLRQARARGIRDAKFGRTSAGGPVGAAYLHGMKVGSRKSGSGSWDESLHPRDSEGKFENK